MHSGNVTQLSDGTPPLDWSTAARPIVMVSGCYDLLHSGHAAFFADAKKHGNLYVSVGSDVNVTQLKKAPMFPENERLYMVRAIRHVTWAAVCSGMGMLDWEADLDIVKPDVFFVNEDGDRPGKREACEKRGITYQVGNRVPAENLDVRSSTSIKAALKEQANTKRGEMKGGGK
jgi:cytidyltransferase-like protein